ncbi:MAG: hypothetical protein JXQ73_28140 [Phycisphaerae bacterium]|nr:hypothetical protein [Phycisphaerae bacterium]
MKQVPQVLIEGDAMVTAYLVCAAIGGTILVCQLVLTVLGLAGGEHDLVDGSHDLSDVGHDIVDGDHGFSGDHGGHGFDADHGSAADGHDAHDAMPHQHGGDARAHDPEAQGSGQSQLGFLKILTFRTVVAAIAFFGLAGLAATGSKLSPTTSLGIATGAGLAALFVVHELMKTLASLRSEGTVRIQTAVGQPGRIYLRVPGNRSGAGKVTLKLQNRTMEYKAVTNQGELPTGTDVVVVDVIGGDTVEVQRASEHRSTNHA